MNKQRLIIVLGAIFFGLMVIVALFFAYQQSQMGRLVTASTPKDLTLTLDGKQIAPTGQIFIEPGSHELVATRSAFKEKRIPFDIAKGETKEITVFIFPEGGAGQEWVRQNPNEASELDGIISNEYEATTSNAFNGNQILRQLPMIDKTFRIDHGLSKTGREFALYIQATDQAAREDALATLQYYGFDPAQYEIIYLDPPR